MDACQIHDVHPVDREEVSTVVSLEDLLGQGDHLLNRDVEFVADAFEEGVDDVEVDDQDVSVDCCLQLQVLVLPEESQQEVPQLLSDRFQVDFLLIEHCLIDPLLDVGFAIVEPSRKVADQGTHLFVLHELLRVVLLVFP